MTDIKTIRPPEGTPEFKQWLKEQAAKDIKDIFGEDHKPADFEEGGTIFGDIDNLEKSDAECFPDELEEQSPEERRKNLKVYGNDSEPEI